jgi:hypothetical protein
MESEKSLWMITSPSIGFAETPLYSDHIVTFIPLLKSEKWSNLKPTLIRQFCGRGHV